MNRKVYFYPILALLVLAGAITAFTVMGAAEAQCTPTTGYNGATVNCTGTDSNGFSGPNNMNITVQPGANVNNSADTHLNGMRVNDSNTITNNGTIQGVGFGGGDGLKGDNGNTIDNNGLIYSQHHDAVDVLDNNTIINDNTIQSDGDKGVDSGNGLNLTNNDTIIGTGDGVYTGSNTTVDNNAGATIQSTQQDGVDAGNNLTLTNDGTIISGNGDGSAAYDAIDAGNGATIVNNGTISGNCDGVDVGMYSEVENNGDISSERCKGVTVDYGSTVDNNGTIDATTGSSAVDLNNSSTLENSGDIVGRCRGVEGDANFTVINEEGGTITGLNCDAIYATQGNTSVSNAGTIQTARTGGDGIDIDYGTIENTGTISGISDGIEVNGTVSGTTDITNEGTITGGSMAINTAAGGNADMQNVTNAGTLESGSATTVSLGAGNDSFTAYVESTSTGRIDGGTGFDTFIVSHDNADEYPVVQAAAATASTSNCPCTLQFTVAGINFRYVYMNFERVTSELRASSTAAPTASNTMTTAPVTESAPVTEVAASASVAAEPVASAPVVVESAPVVETAPVVASAPVVETAPSNSQGANNAAPQAQMNAAPQSAVQSVPAVSAPPQAALPQFEGNRSNNITNTWAQVTKGYVKGMF